MMDYRILLSLGILIIIGIFLAGCTSEEKAPPPQSIPGPSIIDLEDIAATNSGILLTDAIGRQVMIPRNITHVLCSGPGCMRYLAYLRTTDRAVGADQAERNTLSPLPYLEANPRIRNLPATGKETGAENLTQISNLDPRPDLIILMGDNHPVSADDIQKQTGIPVIVLQEGDLSFRRSTMNYSLRVMGLVLGKSERAEEVIQFFDKVTDNLQTRTQNIPDFQKKKNVYWRLFVPRP